MRRTCGKRASRWDKFDGLVKFIVVVQLCFQLQLPPLGYTTVNVDVDDRVSVVPAQETPEEAHISNDLGAGVRVDGRSGQVRAMSSSATQQLTQVEQQMISFKGRLAHREKVYSFFFTLAHNILSSRYEFMPVGGAKTLPTSGHRVRVIDGPVRKLILVHGRPEDIGLMHKLALNQGEDSVLMETSYNIANQKDFELGMRWTFANRSAWSADDQIFTDSNGYVVSKTHNHTLVSVDQTLQTAPQQRGKQLSPDGCGRSDTESRASAEHPECTAQRLHELEAG